jgi:hypothetical protein
MSLSIGKAWTDTVAVVQRRLGEFVLPAAAFGFLPAIVVARFGDVEHVGRGAALLLQLATMVIGVVGQAAIIAMTVSPGMDVGTAIRRGAAATPRVVVVLFALFCAALPSALAYAFYLQSGRPLLALAGFLLALPVLYWAIRLSVVTPAVVVEDAAAVPAMRRSWALTAGGVPRLLLLFAVIFFALLFVSVVLGAVGALLSGGTPQNPSFLTELLLSAVGAAFGIVLSAALGNVYLQLRG